jgi:hypothetical protein
MVIRLGIDVVMTELIKEIFRRKSETCVRRPEASMRLQSGAKQTIMGGNAVVASGQQQHVEGSTRVGKVLL